MTDSFKFDSSFEEQLSANVRENVIVPWAKAVTDAAKRNVPVDSGDLQEDIDYEIVSDTEARIGSDLDYAASVELGSRPHIIRARAGGVLTDGSEFFGPEVNHPGTPAQPYLRPALYEGLA